MQTVLETIAKFPKEVMLKYDFTKAIYTGALTRIENIQCPTHGIFSQYAAQFRKGNGCPTCGHNIRGANKRLDQQEFINTCKLYFGDKYSYEATIYHTMKDKIIVTCAEHGAFSIAAIKHYYSKQGCSKCAVYTRGVHKSTQPRLLTAITKKANAGKMKRSITVVKSDGTKEIFQSLAKLHETHGISIVSIIRACKVHMAIAKGFCAGWQMRYTDEMKVIPDVPDMFKGYPRSRQEAKEKGANAYYTGTPCNRGHIGLRRVKGSCAQCDSEDEKAVRALKNKGALNDAN